MDRPSGVLRTAAPVPPRTRPGCGGVARSPCPTCAFSRRPGAIVAQMACRGRGVGGTLRSATAAGRRARLLAVSSRGVPVLAGTIRRRWSPPSRSVTTGGLMKLVFPGGEHPQVLLDAGVNRVGSDPHGQVVIDRPDIAPRLCQLHVTAQGVMLDVPDGASIEVNGRRVDGLIALRPGDSVALGGIEARLAGVGTTVPGAGAGSEVEGRGVDGLAALRPGDGVALGGIEARLAGVGPTVPGAGDGLAALPPANDVVGAAAVRPVVPAFVLRCVAGSLFGRN